jgi:CRP-like cAMP-binding protein
MLSMITVEQLQQIPIFREMTADEIRYLARKLEEREYKKDEVIYREGETPCVLYLVQHGAVEITKNTPAGHRQADNSSGSFLSLRTVRIQPKPNPLWAAD